ncbi:hypothetical protein BDR03DRAFT_1016192 [Suillus americanus]|nr:hypothetical protein BDR03DRAFT_1016192 [Suillus americanus]
MFNLKAYKGTVSVWAHGIKNLKTSSAVSLLQSEANPTSTSGISTPSQFTKIVGSLLDEGDKPERLAAHAIMKKRPGSPCTDVIEVDDDSLSTPPLPPPSQYQFNVTNSFSPIKGGLLDVSMDDNDDNDKSDSEDSIFVDSVKASPIAGSKRVTLKMNVDVFNDLDVPPIKCIKQEASIDTSRMKVITGEKKTANGEVLRMKYKNSDLPTSCQDGNAWRGLLIPTIAHAAGRDNIYPWLIKDNILILFLTKAWKVVYAGKPTLINCSITPGYAVYYVQSRFWSAAVMMVTSLMAVSPIYESEDSRVGFANFWLEDNRFLIGDVDSGDKREWSGTWQSTFVLQTFAAHLNYTQGHVPVLELNSEESVLQTALSLAAAAVKCALNLLATREMTFKIKSTTSKGKKKPLRKGKAPAAEVEWTTVIGENESFSEPL